MSLFQLFFAILVVALPVIGQALLQDSKLAFAANLLAFGAFKLLAGVVLCLPDACLIRFSPFEIMRFFFFVAKQSIALYAVFGISESEKECLVIFPPLVLAYVKWCLSDRHFLKKLLVPALIVAFAVVHISYGSLKVSCILLPLLIVSTLGEFFDQQLQERERQSSCLEKEFRTFFVDGVLETLLGIALVFKMKDKFWNAPNVWVQVVGCLLMGFIEILALTTYEQIVQERYAILTNVGGYLSEALFIETKIWSSYALLAATVVQTFIAIGDYSYDCFQLLKTSR
jgi:hypothetical protein